MIFVPSSQGILNQLGDAGIPTVRINQNLATPSSQEHPDVVVKDLIYACQKDGMGPDSMPDFRGRNWRLEPINLVKLVVHDQNPQKVAVGREIPGHFKEIQVGDIFDVLGRIMSNPSGLDPALLWWSISLVQFEPMEFPECSKKTGKKTFDEPKCDVFFGWAT